MSISTIYILDLLGKPLMTRSYRDPRKAEPIDQFMSTVVDHEEDDAPAPVLRVGDINFVYVRTGDVYVVASTAGNANIALVFVFLYRAVQVFKDYLREVEEESIRDNFVILYEILDEIMDFGYPQVTESNILMEYITQESKKLEVQKTIPSAVTNAISWRSPGIVYKKNEVFIDVVESIYIVAKSNGTVIRSEVHGSIRITSKLSGMPELRLGLNDRLVQERSPEAAEREHSRCVDLDELKFHQCVRLTKFHSDRSISFVPPDGEFELMSYRINTFVKPPIWVDCVSKVFPHRRTEYTVKVTSHFKGRYSASFVHVLIPVPSDVDSPRLQAAVGSVSYIPEDNLLEWTLKNLPGGREYFLVAKFGLPTVSSLEKETVAPIRVQFEIPFYNISGMHVHYLRVTEKSGYQSLPWVRYLTQNGDYEIRQRELLQLKHRS